MKTKGKRVPYQYILAWIFPASVMLVVFIAKEIYPFGDRSFLTADLYHQYMPFLTEFAEKLKTGGSMGYDWRLGLGSNYMALYVYYLASPVNWLVFFVPREYIVEFLSYMVICKVGACGLTCCIYLRRHFRTGSYAVVLFSVLYGLSGWMCAYNYNIMWLDCVILLPLILLGLERLVKEEKCLLYSITLAFSILTNFYISIMICIFLVLYFLFLYLTEGGKTKTLLLFTLHSLLAGGLAGVLLIPEVCAILATDFGNSSFPQTIRFYFPVLEELARHCFGVSAERGLDHWPNLYCGAVMLLLIPMYVLNDRIPQKRRFGYLALAGFMLLSFSTNILDFLWHGFNYPDSLPARQSFLYILLVITMACEVFIHVEELETKHILYGYLAAVVFLLINEKFITDDAFGDGIELLTLLFVTLYAVLLHYYHVHREGEWRNVLAVLATCVILLETGINLYDTSVNTVSRSTYLEPMEDYQALYQKVSGETEDFFRVEMFSRRTKNDGTLMGYPTATIFSSTLNSAVTDFYQRLGMRYSKVFYSYDGATAFTSALLNVRYLFGNTEDAEMDAGGGEEYELYVPVDSSGDVVLYESKASLPLGYVAPYGYDLPEGSEGEPLRLQNQMVRSMDIDGMLFSRVSVEQDEEDVRLEAEEDGYYYMVVTASGTKKIHMESSAGSKEYTDLKDGSVLCVGFLREGEEILCTNGDDSDETPQIRLEAYRMDTEILTEALERLSRTHLTDVVYDDSHVSGYVELQEPGRLILSIPYEAGWTILVNGEETEPVLFGECFMALDLQPGSYEIVMSYVPRGRHAGELLSAVSLVLFIAVFGWRRAACGRRAR